MGVGSDPVASLKTDWLPWRLVPSDGRACGRPSLRPELTDAGMAAPYKGLA